MSIVMIMLVAHVVAGLFVAYVLGLTVYERWVMRGRGTRDHLAPWMFDPGTP